MVDAPFVEGAVRRRGGGGDQSLAGVVAAAEGARDVRKF